MAKLLRVRVSRYSAFLMMLEKVGRGFCSRAGSLGLRHSGHVDIDWPVGDCTRDDKGELCSKSQAGCSCLVRCSSRTAPDSPPPELTRCWTQAQCDECSRCQYISYTTESAPGARSRRKKLRRDRKAAWHGARARVINGTQYGARARDRTFTRVHGRALQALSSRGRQQPRHACSRYSLPYTRDTLRRHPAVPTTSTTHTAHQQQPAASSNSSTSPAAPRIEPPSVQRHRFKLVNVPMVRRVRRYRPPLQRRLSRTLPSPTPLR